jgi:hypothetical protein
MKEFGMRIVHAYDNAEIFLNSRHKELKQGPTLVLISHFLLKLRQERLKLFWSVQSRYFSC